MREDQINRVKTRSSAIESGFDDFLKFLGELSDKDGRAFDISRTISGTDSSISDLRARTALIAGLIRKFDDKNKGAALTPLSDFVSLVNASNAVVNTINQAKEAIQNHVNANGGLQSIDYENLNLVGGNGNAISVQGNLKSLFDSVESYLQAFQFVFQATSPSRAAFNFSAAATSLSKIISRASDSRDKLTNSMKAATEELGKVKKKQAEFDAVLDDIRAKQATLDSQAAQANEAVAHITTRNDEATALNASTNELKERVEAYQGEFQAFQNQLDSMKSKYDSSDKKLTDLISRFNKQAETFEGMIERSDQMLSASTVAGLATEFGNIRNDLDKKLVDSHSSFKWSIAFLFISALPLALFIFAPFIALLFPQNQELVRVISGIGVEQNSWHYVGQVFARFIILLPAIWYVTFCTSRYNSLFKLKEHYSYKYSMAVAVEGFKKQAPQYEDMIAALVFEQLAFNPVDKLGKHSDSPESPPNPISNLLVKILRRDADAGQ